MKNYFNTSKIGYIFTEIWQRLFPKNEKVVHYSLLEINEDLINSSKNLRGINSSIKHYSAMSTSTGLLLGIRKHYAKKVQELHKILSREEREYETLIALRLKSVNSSKK